MAIKSRLFINSYLKLLVIGIFPTVISCNKNAEIERLLKSETAAERCEGAWKAGQAKNKAFVPLLLKNANDASASTDLRFKGFTVYTETMFALESILKVSPPRPYKEILTLPDTVNIKFYSTLWYSMEKRNKLH